MLILMDVCDRMCSMKMQGVEIEKLKELVHLLHLTNCTHTHEATLIPVPEVFIFVEMQTCQWKFS